MPAASIIKLTETAPFLPIVDAWSGERSYFTYSQPPATDRNDLWVLQRTATATTMLPTAANEKLTV